MTTPPTRRQRKVSVIRQFGLPLAIALVSMVALVTLAFVSGEPGAVAAFAGSLLIALPLAICLFPVCLGLFALVAITGRGGDSLQRLTQRAVRFSDSVPLRIDRVSERATKAAIDFNARFAGIERALNTLMRQPEPDMTSHKEDEHGAP